MRDLPAGGDQSGGATFQPAWPPFAEFVTLVALMMSLVAFSIDSILPALGAIRDTYGVTNENDLQFVIYAYMAGFGLFQIVVGPIADMAGRRPVMMIGLAVYLAATAIAFLADSFEWLLIGRFLQGAGGAATRVLVVTLVRDRYQGREMARVMSLVMMLFITVPIVAPAIGSAILVFGSWRLIVASMFALGLIICVWFFIRMPESLRPDYRRPIAPRAFMGDIGRIVRSRTAFGYTLAMMLTQSVIMIYIGVAAQTFETDVYRLGPVGFPLVFGVIGVMMGVASFVNSRLVVRLGMRFMSHSALLAFIGVTLVMTLVTIASSGVPPLGLFLVLMAISHFLFSLTMPNFNTMAMEDLGDIAGTASSFIGFFSTVGSTLIAAAISRTFDSTVMPLAGGYLAMGVLCLVAVLWTERGRLLRPRNEV